MRPDLAYFHDKSSAERQLLRNLRTTRCGYDQERILHNFLLDAYVGGGGFQNGLIPSPEAPFWGRRAYERGRSLWMDNRAYLLQAPQPRGAGRQATQSNTSYLVAFHGEDYDSYLDRIKTSAYHNPVEKLVRVTNALLFQQDAQRDHLPQPLVNWLPNVDRRHRPLNQFARNMGLRGQLFGWAASLADLPNLPPMGSLYESLRANHVPYLVPLCPQEILDWDRSSDDTITALKTSTMHEHPRRSMFDLKLWEEHITIIYPSYWERYVILMPPPQAGYLHAYSGPMASQYFDPEEGRLYAQEQGENPFGEVPASFFAWDEGFGAVSSYGLPQIFNVAKTAWDLFQQNSELRRIMRDQTFATLITPAAVGGTAGNKPMGTGNYLSERASDKGIHRFISPPSAPAQVYEKRIDSTTEMLHQISGLDMNSRRFTETAEAMRIRFQQTEAMLYNAATNLEHWETTSLRHVGRAFSLKDSALDAMSIYRSKTFDVGRFSAQIDEALKGLRMPFGKEGYKALLRRTMRSLLPNASEKDIAEYDREVDKMVEENYDSLLQKALATTGSASTSPAQP
jgi:hypothetical protein